MTLSHISPLTFWLGLLGLAGLLYALQWLRVRHRREDVVTTLFWKEALAESRARVFVRRFRHPLAYLLALAIGGLIWLAYSGPEAKREDAAETIVLLDGTAGMAAGTRFDEMITLLLDTVDDVGASQRRVFWCGGDTRLLLDRGEETVLLKARLQGLQPEAASPRAVEKACLTLAHSSDERPVNLVLLGDAPVSDEVTALLPDTVTLQRLALPPKSAPLLNHGIRALGMAPSTAGFAAVDVYLRTTLEGPAWAFQLGGSPYQAEATSLGAGEWLLHNVPAQGEQLEVRLAQTDALPVDDTAFLQLPTRRPVRVSVSEDTPEVLRRLLMADPALELVQTEPQVAIGSGTETSGLPSFTWAPMETQEDAFIFVSDDAEPETLFTQLGMEQIDATGLAQTSGAVIRLRVDPGEIRRVNLWDTLLTPEYNWTHSAAFPLFVAKTVRWLAEIEDVDPYVSVGERHRHFTVAGVSYAPPRAGDYEDAAGKIWTASLQDPPLPGSDDLSRVQALAGGTNAVHWITWLILAALFLLGLEWVLFQKGRIP